jgi:TetR/AcrR family transcriptional repressor of lmrAB and yxaGH operons
MPIPATGARDRFKGAALTLLRQGGLSAAGLNEVVTLAHAPKGSLYHYFPAGKLQLVSEALDVYREAVNKRISESLKGRDRLRVRVYRMFRSVERQMAETSFSQSCAVGTVVLDLRPEDGDLRQVCESVLAEWAMVAAHHLHELPDARRANAGRVLVTLLEGAQLAARAARNGSPLREAAEAFLMYADAIAQAPNGRLQTNSADSRRSDQRTRQR